MSFNSIVLQKNEGIAKITLNRPEKLNAIDRSIIDELAIALEDVGKDRDVRAIIIAGAELPDRKPSFSVGADLKKLGFNPSAKPTEIFAICNHANSVFRMMEKMNKPVIAMVNGYCMGGGCELAMACDLIIASDNSQFSQPEINLGFMPGWGGTQRLPRRVGLGRALKIILTGETVTAEAAERIGLIDQIVPKEKLEEAVMDLARKLRDKSPLSLRLAKHTTRMALETNIDAGLILESQAFASCFSTEDLKEGLTAFWEKRKPKFKGR